MSRVFQAIKRFLLFHSLRLFRLRGETEKIARGFALGLVVNLFPTFGLGVLISGAVARMLGGNAIAGLVGGASLAFAWPLLFYLNIKTGNVFVNRPEEVLDDLAHASEASLNAMAMGHAFLMGAIVNSILIGGAAYVCLRALHARLRPAALSYIQRQMREEKTVLP
jgi:uncharacterized protein (DUF2062 family)